MFNRIAFAVQSDCVRRPIRLRSPSNQIASAVQSDCVRRPIRLRPPSNRVASAVQSYNHRMYTLSIKSDSNTQKGMAFIEPCLFVCVIVLSTPSALTTFVV